MNDPLAILNRLVESGDENLFPAPPPSTNVFVIGSPRSGTTILTQMLTYLLDIGYINNLTAAFWNSPALGVLISRKLVNGKSFAGVSEFGVTNDVSEPHEFGGFWRKHLDYPDMTQQMSHPIAWSQLLHSLDQIGAAWQKPVIYKVFQLYWHLVEFHQLRPDTKWIWVERDPIDNAASLQKLYLKRKEVDGWTSAVPREALRFGDHGILPKCAAQIHYTNQWIRNQLALIPHANWLRVPLGDLVNSPNETMRYIGDFLGMSFVPADLKRIEDSIVPSQPVEPRLGVDFAEAFRIVSRGEK